MFLIYIDELDAESRETLQLAFNTPNFYILDSGNFQGNRKYPQFQGGFIFSSHYPGAAQKRKTLQATLHIETSLQLIGIYSAQDESSKNMLLSKWDDVLFRPFTPEEARYRLRRISQRLKFSLGSLGTLFSELDYHYPLQSFLRWLRSKMKADSLFLFEKGKSGYQLNQKVTSIQEINHSWLLPENCGLEDKSDEVVFYHDPASDLLVYLKSVLNKPFKNLVSAKIAAKQQTYFLLILWENKAFNASEANEWQMQWKEFLINAVPLMIEFEGLSLGYSEKREFLTSLINRLNFGIMVTDSQNRIRFINQPAADLLKKGADSLLGQDVEVIFGKENSQALFKTEPEESGIYERPELQIVDTDGEKIAVGFTRSAYIFPETGENGFIFSLKDITYSKELQEEMRRIDRLASLGVMASGIAHEIRNPLAGIKAIAQTFEEELEPADPKHEFVKRIIRQVNRLDDMLKALFSYAKPQKPNPVKCSIKPILTEVLMLQKQKLLKHQIRLIEFYEENLPPLFIDSGQIQQVLFNLILNSIEAIENKGEITIRVNRVGEVTNFFKRKPFYKKITERPYVQIQISDTGKGIESKDLNQIFNPFFTTKPFGTGLGLSIVYQITKENDGVIYFESEVGKGTDCYLFLPAFVEDNANWEQK
ncbi:MAG: hypothetical protein Kow0037_03910 [Calditrichia bacterium]